MKRENLVTKARAKVSCFYRDGRSRKNWLSALTQLKEWNVAANWPIRLNSRMIRYRLSDVLLRRKLSLDVMQQHIFHLAIGQKEEPWDDKEKLPVFEIRVDAYAALTGRSPRQGLLYDQLKKAVRGMQHAEVAQQEENG